MKTTMKIIGLLLVIAITGLTFSSFIGKNPSKTEDDDAKRRQEYNNVSTFIRKTICEPIRAASPYRKLGTHEFSRCPSGYFADINSKRKDVTKGNFVFGTVKLNKGCSLSKYVCDFKVCVDKEIALVKSRGSRDYITVSEWLTEKKKKQEQKDIVMKAL